MSVPLRNLINLTKILKPKSFRTKLAFYSNEKTDKKDEMNLLKTNPYFEKYEEKLKAVYKENPKTFLENLKNKQPEKIGDGPISDLIESKMEHALNRRKNLDCIMKTEMLNDLPPEEIKNIWSTYMKERSRLSDMLTLDEYSKIRERSKQFNTFLFPLQKDQGFEFILTQWSANECHFTSLINFQAHGENAPSIMSAIYYDDLKDTKKVVLEMVEVDTNTLKMEEAKLLMHLMKLYYLKSEDNDEKYTLMNIFTKKPDEFKHMDIIKQFENDNLNLENFKE
ncbi:ATP synthase mitochondrial F1 complex assembly factor 1 [Brachionus plicatilis]|uniref:ATP synthase mitochondrial F1 complex assembly factor 1 n=1 Tax=Brachionus plicatilis TaxID=10195 RepID=A0A3M7SGJ9_BRAPC|nr:ATP synthase mitochondrial F1 complex assembly factor 1 [Brachionus plicatilis]